ncbi:hypothetical protein V6Z11_D10G234800 [Gossypium hirsutum]
MLKTIRSRSLPEQPQVRSTKLIMLMDITRKDFDVVPQTQPERSDPNFECHINRRSDSPFKTTTKHTNRPITPHN